MCRLKDLNMTSSKDDFLPYMNILTDKTTKNTTYSFMDDFSIYSHIKMTWEDKEKTTFITP
jgi:hypothetical protein